LPAGPAAALVVAIPIELAHVAGIERARIGLLKIIADVGQIEGNTITLGRCIDAIVSPTPELAIMVAMARPAIETVRRLTSSQGGESLPLRMM